ncbi:MAG: hypothetical protein R3E77_15395 [Steroidobacteraceae bacterium]
MNDTDSKQAWIAGASGFVGSRLLSLLLEVPDFTRVVAITRRPLPGDHSRLANRIVQFERLEAQLKGSRCDTAFCCLGTTIKRAGSQAEFRRVDHDLVMAFGRAARAGGAQRFVLLTAAGANSASTNFYLRTKGELETAVAALGFSSLDILQPGLLLGLRRELRPAELAAMLVMPAVNPFLGGPRRQYRAISANTVARAMLGCARSGRRGVYRYAYDAMQELGKLRTAPGN